MREWFPVEGIMSLDVCGMGSVEIFQLVIGLGDSQSLSSPIYGWVCNIEPRESKDDVFSATLHNIEEMFLSNSFNVCVKGVGVVFSACFH